MALRLQVLGGYRSLLRASRIAFGHDLRTLGAFRQQLRERMEQHRALDAEQARQQLAEMADVEAFMRNNLVQGQLNSRGNFGVLQCNILQMCCIVLHCIVTCSPCGLLVFMCRGEAGGQTQGKDGARRGTAACRYIGHRPGRDHRALLRQARYEAQPRRDHRRMSCVREVVYLVNKITQQ